LREQQGGANGKPTETPEVPDGEPAEQVGAMRHTPVRYACVITTVTRCMSMMSSTV
jgi:hypothetical protein